MRSKRRGRIKESDLIAALVLRKENYERYFEQKENSPAPPVSKDPEKGEKGDLAQAIEPDHKAEQAYTGLIKTIVELMRKSGPAQASPEEMRKRAKEILESEYGVKR